MSKRNILTAAGLAVSFIIAIGGWMVTSWLMDVASDRLLSKTELFALNMPSIESTHLHGYRDDPHIPLGLTKNEMISILSNWELTDYRRPHQPADGQIDMEQAIMAGRTGLTFLYEKDMTPAHMLTPHDIRATLHQNVPQWGDFLPLQYSYWDVTFRTNNISVDVTIHAVTGQIWGMAITLHPEYSITTLPTLRLSLDDSENILLEFLLNAGAHSIGEIGHALSGTFLPMTPDMILSSRFFADERGSAVMATTHGIVTDDALYFSQLTIQLIATDGNRP